MKKQFLFGLVGVAAFLLVTNNALAIAPASTQAELKKYYQGTVQSIGRDYFVISTKDARIIEKTATVLDDEDQKTDYSQNNSNNKKDKKTAKNTPKQSEVANKKQKGADRIVEMMQQKKKDVAAKVAKRQARKEGKSASNSITITVKATPALIAQNSLATGAKVLIDGSYNPNDQVLVARTIVDTTGKSIKKNR